MTTRYTAKGRNHSWHAQCRSDNTTSQIHDKLEAEREAITAKRLATIARRQTVTLPKLKCLSDE